MESLVESELMRFPESSIDSPLGSGPGLLKLVVIVEVMPEWM